MARIINSVLGHADVIDSLISARVRHRLAPLMLFVGPSGIGKKKIALALAQALLCEVSPQACGHCGSCLRLEKGAHEGLVTVEPTTAQIRVDDVKPIHEFMMLQRISRARVVILDSAELLNPFAANSLLKIFEEPPPETYFILITSQVSEIITTIRSRAQIVRFHGLPLPILRQLSNAPDWMLESAQGRMDFLHSNDRGKLEGRRQSALNLLLACLGGEFSKFSQIFKEDVSEREAATETVEFWLQFLRDAWFQQSKLKPILHSDLLSETHALQVLPLSTLDSMVQNALHIERDLRANVDRTLAFEEFWLKTQRMMGAHANEHTS